MRGTVKLYNEAGWGFITPDEGDADVFIDRNELRRSSIDKVLPGQRIEFTPIEQFGKSQLKATRISICDLEQSQLPSCSTHGSLPPNQTADESQIRHLWNWAYFPDKEQALHDLAKNFALNENWNFQGNPSTNYQYPILYNFVQYTFARLFDEGKIKRRVDGDLRYATFNTGLVNKLYEPIFALFRENKNVGMQPWIFRGFCVPGSGQLGKDLLRLFPNPPSAATYCTEIDELIYRDPSRHPYVDWEHVIVDGIARGRFPLQFLSEVCAEYFSESALPSRLESEGLEAYFRDIAFRIRGDEPMLNRIKSRIDEKLKVTLKRVGWNFKTAIPMWFPTTGKMSLLLPLCLRVDGEADVALVVEQTKSKDGERTENGYIGHTILPLDVAYMDARLICRPDSDWLTPRLNPIHTDVASDEDLASVAH